MGGASREFGATVTLFGHDTIDDMDAKYRAVCSAHHSGGPTSKKLRHASLVLRAKSLPACLHKNTEEKIQ